MFKLKIAFSFVAIILTLSLISACGGEREKAQDNVDVANQAIDEMNKTQIALENLYIKITDPDRSSIKLLNDEQLVKAMSLLDGYITNATEAINRASNKNVRGDVEDIRIRQNNATYLLQKVKAEMRLRKIISER